MKKIEKLDAIIRKEITIAQAEVNRTFFMAYVRSLEANTDVLDFDDVVWVDDVPDVVDSIKRYGIEEFTTSSTYSGLQELLMAFVKNGCYLSGITMVFTRYTDMNDKREMRPAMVVKVNRGVGK